VNRRLRSHFTQSDWANDQLTGIGSLFSIRQLAQEVESDWHAVRARLQSVHAALVNRNAMLVNITLDAPDWPGFRPKLTAFLADLPLVPVEHAQWTRPMLPANEGFAIPSQVNSVGKGADLFRLGYMSHGSALAITRHLGSTWIWNKIRAEGGAYGASAGFDHLSGVFTYLSNYDPNLLQTLNAYDGTSDFLRGVELSEDEVTKSIIGAIGAMDKYQLRDAQGFTSMARHLAGDDDENRQRLREELLSTTAAHFKSFADVLSAVQREGHVVIIAAEERLRTANDQRDGEWLTVTRAL
jgi:Zn-dependent M16 (insulinase) family peptidase